MSTATLIIGESGTGKSASLRNLTPADTLLIQCLPKPLPFRSEGWATGKAGNILQSDHHEKIVKAMNGTQRDLIVIDDFQYLMSNEWMRRSYESGFEKYAEIGRHAWDVLKAATELGPQKRVYVLCHSYTDDRTGRIKAKTVGKLLDEKITVEGLFTIVMRTVVTEDGYWFSTKNNNDTSKTPMGLFEDELIPNDLAAVDAALVDYWQLPVPATAPARQPVRSRALRSPASATN